MHPGLPRMVPVYASSPSIIINSPLSISVVSLGDQLCGHPNCELF